MSEQKQQIYEFDNFRLDVPNRELLRNGTAVALPAKAFDMLVVLIENGGRLVDKDELFRRVWPDQIVEESNLTVQVSAIRKALGERRERPAYIVTVPGHGYRFTGKVLSLDEEEEELVIERHSISGLVIEGSQEQAGGAEESLVKNFAAQSVGHLTAGNKAEASKRPRAVGWRTLLFTGLVLIAISLGVFLVLKRSRSPDKTASAAPIKSIAVLPFKPLVAGSRDESLELGIAETLITRLSSLREIDVRPTTAVRKASKRPRAVGIYPGLCPNHGRSPIIESQRCRWGRATTAHQAAEPQTLRSSGALAAEPGAVARPSGRAR
jgi:serine/threonine-protein kinase